MTIIKFIELKTIKTPKHQENGNKANNKFGELSIGTSLLNSVSFLSQQMEDMETRRKAFMKELWGDVTLFDLIGRSGASANRQTYSSSSTFGFTPLYVTTPDAFVQNYYAYRAALFFANEEYKIDLQIRGSVLLRDALIKSTYLNANEGARSQADEYPLSSTIGNIVFVSSTLGQIAAERTANDLRNTRYIVRGQNLITQAAQWTKVARGIGITGAFIGTGISGFKIFATNEAKPIDYLDFGVGGTALGFAIFSNPVGWGVGAAFGIGATVYFTVRLAYDFYKEVNK